MATVPRSESIARDWLADGRRVVACTLVEAVAPAPLDPGAEMVVDDTGKIEGSVTGGCVEGALVEEPERIVAGGPPRVATYGISDADAFDVGLMCKGTVRELVHEVDPCALQPLDTVVEALEADHAVALATLLDGEAAGAKIAVTEDGVVGTLGVTDLLDRSVERDARGSLDHGLSAVRRYVFTHDSKFDEPALVAALKTGAGYTGARTPVETAISILAEVIARRTGRSSEPLEQTSGPIHGREAVAP